MVALMDYLRMIAPLSQEGCDYFYGLLKEKALDRKQYLLKAGHVCQHIFFIDAGLLRCFYEKDGREVNSWFMKEGDIIVSVESFFRQKISYEFIQALEPCALQYMSYSELNSVYRKFPEFNLVGRLLTEKYYCLSEQRLYAIRMMRARERYEYLLTHDAEMIQRVPSKYISSYLGISEETLSRIRSEK